MFRKLMSAKGQRSGTESYQTLGQDETPPSQSFDYNDAGEAQGRFIPSPTDRAAAGGSSSYVPPQYFDPAAAQPSPQPPTYNAYEQPQMQQPGGYSNYSAGSYVAQPLQPAPYTSYSQPPPQQYSYVGRPAAESHSSPSSSPQMPNQQTLQMLREELATVAECAEVLGDMCAAVDANTSLASVTEVVGDLVELCRALKPHALDIIENVTDEGCLNLALTVHDELTRVLQSYDKMMSDQNRRDVSIPLIDLSIDDSAPPSAPSTSDPFAPRGTSVLDPFASLEAPPMAPVAAAAHGPSAAMGGLDEAKVTQVKALTRRAAILLEFAGGAGAGPRGSALMAVAGQSPLASPTSPTPASPQPHQQAPVPRVQMQADLLGGQGMPPAMGNPLYQSPPPQAQLASSPPMSPPLPQRPVPQRPPPAAADDIHEWDCQTCTYKHVGPEAGFLACSVCGSPRP